MATRPPQPWALGVRLAEEPEGAHHLTIAAGAPADARRIVDLPTLPAGAWISLVVRERRLFPEHDDNQLQAGDELLIIAPTAGRDQFRPVFEVPEPPAVDG